jgi:thiamine pyrophosphokinase
MGGVSLRALLVLNGSIFDYNHYKSYIERSEFVICGDGGARHLKKMGLKPDVLLGDFDSISKKDLEYYKSKGTEIMEYPVKKDRTDAEIAVDYAIDSGFSVVTIIGAVGTRIDHSLSNIHMLKKLLDNGITGVIANENNEVTLISKNITLEKEENVKITLLPFTEKVYGVTTRGLYYPLEDAVIKIGESIGVSNEFSDAAADISIKSGLLLVIKSWD